jgi:hypothetical protein
MEMGRAYRRCRSRRWGEEEEVVAAGEEEEEEEEEGVLHIPNQLVRAC